MSNSYFQFKQFTIHQDQCAMKVCTDACLFGAWLVDELRQHRNIIKQSLDVGTGTGLLSLMLAQEFDFTTDAVEIDLQAAIQAQSNVSNSPWTEKIAVISKSILDHHPNEKYDLIFSNPPFFENDLVSLDDKKNAAKHNSTLTLEKLVECSLQNLSDKGIFAVLLPFHRTNYFEHLLADKGLFVFRKTIVKQTHLHNHFRAMLLCSKASLFDKLENEIVIQDKERNYTPEFKNLLKAYYLNL